jgi:hypothetical protein
MDQPNQIDALLTSINRDIEDVLEHSDETSWEDQFAEIMIEHLTEAGEIDDGELC